MSRPPSAIRLHCACWASTPSCWLAMWVMPDASALAPAPALRAVRVAEETLLGFDFGTKRIGVSLGNTLTRSARPLEIIASEPLKARFARIAALLAEWQPDRVIV